MHPVQTNAESRGRLNVRATDSRLCSMKLVSATRGALTLAVLSTLLVVAARPALAQSYEVLYSFGGYAGDADGPIAGLVVDKEGNLYGTTLFGGAYNLGAVFEATATGTEKVLYSFCAKRNCADGSSPYAGLALDKKGNLYGTTYIGGAYNGGTVFEITTAGTEKVLHSFGSQPDGNGPYAGLVIDEEGNLYGTTVFGGAYYYGTVFEITSDGAEKVLYSFCSQPNCADGFYPYAGLVFDKKGNLYGTTSDKYDGYRSGYGTVFEITAAGTENLVYSFGGRGDGTNPYAGLLVFDKRGRLYGTTPFGGAYSSGTVFEITLAGKKAATEKVVYSFGGRGDGTYPYGGVAIDKDGNLWGTTSMGDPNSPCCFGTVFEMTSGGTEEWSFGMGEFGYGSTPYAGMVFNKEGDLFGTTFGGGDGTVFEVIP